MTDWSLSPTLIACLGLVVIALVAGFFDRRRERQRIEDMTAWAANLGFTLEAGLKSLAEARLGADLTSLPLFKRGRLQRVRNLARGRASDGVTTLLFDYRYTVGSGKNSSTAEQTVAAFERPGTTLPAFELKPEGVFSRIGQALGDPDIDFDSSPEFSRQYQLRGSDEDTIRRVFERHAVPFLAQNEGWSVEGAGAQLVVFRHNRREKPDDLSTFLDAARTVMQTIVSG